MGTKQESMESLEKAAKRGASVARQIANPERRAKALALAEQIEARTQDLQKAVKPPARTIKRRVERDQDLER